MKYYKIIKEQILTKRWWDGQLILLEGGAYGHMAHPFDDKNLTFKDLKELSDEYSILPLLLS